MEKIKQDLRTIEVAWTTALVLVIVVVTCVGYEQFYHLQLSQFHTASLICAVLVGLRLGRLVTHGYIGRVLRAQKARFYMMVEHPDGVGGTAQIGRFYFHNALSILVPMLWLIAWVVEIRVGDYHKPGPSIYPGEPLGPEQWTGHFFILIAIAGLMFVLAFWLPMVTFRNFIGNWKRDYLHPELTAVRDQLFDQHDIVASNRASANRTVRHELTERVHVLTSIPDWPVSPVSPGRYISVAVALAPWIAALMDYWFL